MYILTEYEVRKIFEFSKSTEDAICIGSLNDYKEEKLYVSANSLFASHIGIFGNTSSGKSNTLAKIFTECFQKFKKLPRFSRSRFILIDFNGEYISAFDDTKLVYNLSTRGNNGDRIPINREFLEDVELWSIICEATEKTQKPFLSKCIVLFKRLSGVDNFHYYIREMIRGLFQNYFENPALLIKHLSGIKTILSLPFNNTETAFEILNDLQVRNQASILYRSQLGDSGWSNSIEEYDARVVKPIIDSLCTHNNFKIVDEYDVFEFALKYKYLDSLCNHYITEEHIAPLIARFDNRSRRVKR